MSRFLAALFALSTALVAMPACAAAEDELLPVEQAFQLAARAESRTEVVLAWTVAEHYYLYRDRIKITAGSDAVTLGTPSFSAGETKNDEFFGEVVVYHGAAEARVPITVGDDVASVPLRVSIQGCHETDPKICYPPHRTVVDVALPVAMANASVLGGASPLGGNAATLGGSASPLGGSAFPAGSASPLGGSAGTPGSEPLPLPEDQAFRFEAIATAEDGILARFVMPPGYYLYRDKTAFSTQSTPPVTLASPRWPAGVPHKDEHFGDVTVFFDTVEVPLPLATAEQPAQARSLQLTAAFQGCQTDGICYPPMTRTVSLQLPAPASFLPAASTAGIATSSAHGAANEPLSEQDRITEQLREGSPWWNLALFFVIGLAVGFTPCVYPMIPILLGILSGAGDRLSVSRGFVLALAYVLASSVVYAIAGVLTALLGKNVQAMFQYAPIIVAFALLFVVLALAMFGLFELQLPLSWQNRLNAVSSRQRGGSIVGVLVMGALSALIVGACATPVLTGAVIYIAQVGDVAFGALALFVMGLGMGAPLLALGAGAGAVLPRAGAWMDTVKQVFGVVFLGLALWMLERVLDPLWIMLGWAALLIGAGVHLGALTRLPADVSGWRRTWQALGVLLLVLGVIVLYGAAAGGRDVTRPLAGIGGGKGESTAPEGVVFERIAGPAQLDAALAQAAASGQPVLFDFYADWCVECKRMEKHTFTDEAVVDAVAPLRALKIDVTAQTDGDRALQQRFGIIGPPATLFFACQGGERRPLRLVGFEEARAFVERLRRASQC